MFKSSKNLARWFGGMEHCFAEFLGLYLLLEAFKEPETEYQVRLLIFICYYVCHRLEKYVYKISKTTERG